MTLARGIDISSAQKVTSWAEVKRSLGSNGFVIVKATEGRTFTSPTFEKYFAAASSAKILRGTYHFARPTNSAAVEAQHYVSKLRSVGWRSGRDLPPMLDLEDRGGRSQSELDAWATSFLKSVDGSLGLVEPWLRCGVYINRWYRDTYTRGTFLQGRVTWFAAWPSDGKTWPTDAARDKIGTALWQWSDRKPIGGISTPCDADVARPEDLRLMAPAWFSSVPVTKPPVPVPALPALDAAHANPPNWRAVSRIMQALNRQVGSNLHGGFHDAAMLEAKRTWQRKLGHKVTGYLTADEVAELGKQSKVFTVKKKG